MEVGSLKGGPPETGSSHFRRGTNQSGMRDSNERLVLSLVRQHGSLPKTEIARMTGLSAQTVSVIMRELEDEGLLLRQEPIRGRIGQPSIPMALNPEGAFFLGYLYWRRGAPAAIYVARQWRRGLLGGFCSLAAYGIVLWAMTRAPIAAVSALRETSVLFAAIIGTVLLKEGFGFARLAGAASVVAGVAALKL